MLSLLPFVRRPRGDSKSCYWNWNINDVQNNEITHTPNLWYKPHLSRPYNCWSIRCGWSIACRRCSNYIYILHWRPGWNRLRKDNCNTRRETVQIWDLVCLILEIWQYPWFILVSFILIPCLMQIYCTGTCMSYPTRDVKLVSQQPTQ